VAGFELEIEQIRRAAGAARSGGDQLGTVDAGATMGGVPAALLGSRSGGPIATLADSWRQQVTFWGNGLIDHATNLAASADLYAANESAAAEVFAPVHVGGAEEY
jgi:hypothetical protein